MVQLILRVPQLPHGSFLEMRGLVSVESNLIFDLVRNVFEFSYTMQ